VEPTLLLKVLLHTPGSSSGSRATVMAFSEKDFHPAKRVLDYALGGSISQLNSIPLVFSDW